VFDLSALEARVEDYFGADVRRMAHTRRVLAYAQQILECEPANEETVQAAATLHDIGIPEAERKYGTAAGHYQELEGPPIAAELLRELGASSELVDVVCRLVACHHSPGEVDAAEFDVLWDADWLVNLADEYTGASEQKLRGAIERIFRTQTGKRLAKDTYLGRGGVGAA
jgi:hypothetical protein